MKRTTDIIQSFSDMRTDYNAAKESQYIPRLKGVNPAGSGHSYHIRNANEFFKIIERSRHLTRNDVIVGAALKRLVANIVQDGFNLDPQTGDSSLDEDLKSRFSEWSEDPDQCHSEGEYDFHTIERLTLHSILRDGDILHLPLRQGQLQCVEAHRLRTPTNTKRNVVHGVLLDRSARRQEYWVTKEDIGLYDSLRRVNEIKRYPARNESGDRAVFHVYFPEMFSQRRGISALAPVTSLAGLHDDIQFATLVKQQMSSLIAFFREQATGTDDLPYENPLGPTSTIVESDGSIREIEGMACGLDVTGRPGEKLQGFSPNIPSPSYFEHVGMILKFIGANLDLPAAVMLLDPSETNFSSWRGAIEQARVRFRQLQNELRKKFHMPVYRWKVRQWMQTDPALRNAANRPGINIFRHVWNPPSWAYIDPEKDAKAERQQIDGLLNSHRRIQAARGRDFEVVAAELVKDNELYVTRALEATERILSEYPDAGITWKDVLFLTQQSGAPVAGPLAIESNE